MRDGRSPSKHRNAALDEKKMQYEGRVVKQVQQINECLARQKDRDTEYGPGGAASQYSILFDKKGVPSSQSKRPAAGGSGGLARSNSLIGRASFAAGSALLKRPADVDSHRGNDSYGRVLATPSSPSRSGFQEGAFEILEGDSGSRRALGMADDSPGSATTEQSKMSLNEQKPMKSKDTEELHWNTLKKWKHENVEFSKVTDLQRYRFTDSDKASYYKNEIKTLQGFEKVKLPKFNFNDNADFHIMGHFQQNLDTGERYLRIAMREWYEKKDNVQGAGGLAASINSRLKSEVKVQMDREMSRAEVHSLVFYRYNEVFGRMELEDSILYDISTDHLDIMSGGFDNDFFLSKNHETYYFRREKTVGGDGKLSQRFQLFKHSMRSKSIPHYQGYRENDDVDAVQRVEGYTIELPADFYDIDNVQISFLKAAKQFDTLREDQVSPEEQFLHAQFVMIKRKQRKIPSRYSKLLVYHLQDLKQPLFRYDSEEFLAIQCGFFIKGKEKRPEPAIFVFKGFNIDYKIEFEKRPDGKTFTKLTEAKTRDTDEFRRCQQHVIEPRYLQVTLERTGETFGQYFFFNSVTGDVKGIHPFHSTKEQFIAAGINSKKQEVDDCIHRYFFKDQKKGPIIHLESSDGYLLTDKLQRNILHDPTEPAHDQSAVHEFRGDRYFTQRDLIVRLNIEQPEILIWSVKQDSQYSQMKEELKHIKQEGDQTLLLKVLSQFNKEHHPKIYQNNYDPNMMWNNGSIENQYLQNYYIHRSKQDVFMRHNAVSIGSQDFELDEQYLLLDMDWDDGKLQVIKLFDRAVVPDVKLVRYHVSLASQSVLFFFHQRNKSQRSGLYNNTRQMSGVHFFVMKNIPELQRLVIRPGEPHQSLLTNQTAVYVFKDLSTVVKVTTYKRKAVATYQDNAKLTSLSAYNMVFEMVHDFYNPVDDFVPFVFTHRVPSVDEPRFESFLVVFSIRAFIKETYKMVFKQRKVLSSFLTVQKLNQYKGMDEVPGFPKSYREFNMNSKTHGCPMFTRSSNFERDLYGTEKGGHELSQQYSAKYQVGFHHQIDDVKFFEFQELLVTFDTFGRPFLNKDQELFKEGNAAVDLYCPVRIVPIGLRHAIPSRSFQNKIINRGMENNRLVPIVNDSGTIHGCLCLLNTYCLARPPVRITTNGALVDQFCRQTEQREYLMARRGEEVQVLENLGKQCRVCFSNGIISKLDINLLGITESRALQSDPRFHYEMFPLQDRRDETQIKLATPLMLIGYEHYQIYGQLNNTVTVSTSLFKKEIIKRQLFEKIEMLFELYESQKKNLVSSMPSFHEIYKTSHAQKKHCYFQFRYIMRGRNFCNMDYSTFKNSIIKLKQVLDMKDEEIDKLKLVENSALEILTKQLSKSQVHKSHDLMNTCFEMLGLNRFNQFQCNLNYESFIQKGLDNRFTNPIFFIIDYLLAKWNDHKYQDVLMQDLPQLLSQDKISIDAFLNLSLHEQEDNDVEEEYTSNMYCNMEQQLLNPKLPILGDATMKTIDVHDFANIFNINEEVEQMLIHDDDVENELQEDLHVSSQGLPDRGAQGTDLEEAQNGSSPKRRQSAREHDDTASEAAQADKAAKQPPGKAEQQDAEDDEGRDFNMKQVEVEHHFINFYPIIRKIKIDKLMRRQALKKNHTEYLALLDEKPEDFDQIEDLFLADLLFKQESNRKFFNNTSVQKLIDRQYKYTRRLMRNLLLLYIFGFMAPFIYNVFESNSTYSVTQADQDLEASNGGKMPIGRLIRFCIACSVQVLFLSLEYAELSYNGVQEYFSDPFNYVDSSQLIIYVAQVWIQVARGNEMYEHDSFRLWGNFLTITCLFMCTIKLMQFLRYNENFGFLIQMILTVFVDLFPFLTIFIVTVFFFSLVMVIMDSGFDDGDYPKVQRFLIIFLQNFRNSIGDFEAVSYENWHTAEPALRSHALSIIWLFWLLNVFLMVIVLLNFLIAEVSQTYDKVKSQGKMLLYQKKAELNLLAYKIFKMFGSRSYFKVLVFTGPKNDEDLGDDEVGQGFSATIRKDTAEQIAKLKAELLKSQKRVLGMVKAQQQNIEAGIKAQSVHLNQSFNNLEKKISHAHGDHGHADQAGGSARDATEQELLKTVIKELRQDMKWQQDQITLLGEQMADLQSSMQRRKEKSQHDPQESFHSFANEEAEHDAQSEESLASATQLDEDPAGSMLTAEPSASQFRRQAGLSSSRRKAAPIAMERSNADKFEESSQEDY